MEIYIKVTPDQYKRLRSALPVESPAHQAINKATPIEYSLEGILFEGYEIPCDQNQAGVILNTAKHCCPELVPHIEHAVKPRK
jgi:hypothetical protein